jgi:hypothetical protein
MDNMSIKPEREDIARIEREYGPLPWNATDAEHAHRYRLEQAVALERLYGPASQ